MTKQVAWNWKKSSNAIIGLALKPPCFNAILTNKKISMDTERYTRRCSNCASADTAMQLQICLVEDEASGEPDYQAYCLFEMTFAGFDEKTIQGEWNDRIAASEELKSMSETERKAHLVTKNDLLRELGEDD